MSDNFSDIFSAADLPPVDRLVLIYLRSLTAQHGAAWPSYETIAGNCGIVRRTAINVVKRLSEAGYITKEHRYKITDAERLQTSNSYEVADKSSDSPVQSQNAPYNAIAFKPKTEEDENILREAARLKFGPDIAKAVADYARVYGGTRQVSTEAIRQAFEKAAVRMRHGSGLLNPPAWIAAAILNEQRNLDQRAIGRSGWEAAIERAKAATAHLA
ncbi:hypothetical protein J2T17_004681 [Paenibacillus mucilaginosus]|uniref:helix-turn-helix domain-containing protein n=1 Tax=Paenibacillus mucilaginosus TaxID=61624 RepID=UPI003D22442C